MNAFTIRVVSFANSVTGLNNVAGEASELFHLNTEGTVWAMRLTQGTGDYASGFLVQKYNTQDASYTTVGGLDTSSDPPFPYPIDLDKGFYRIVPILSRYGGGSWSSEASGVSYVLATEAELHSQV